MKQKLHKKRNRIFLLGAILIGLISLDFYFTSIDAVDGTFKYESEFDVISGATSTVSIVPSDYGTLANPVSRSTNPSYSQVEDMVRKAIELQGGFDWVIDKGDVVLIKVNLVGADSPSGEGENTDVRVVKALIKIIDEFTEGDVSIQVAEGTARTNDDPTQAGSVWDNSGYRDLLTDSYLSGIDFSLLNLNQSLDDMIEVDLGDKLSSSIQGSKYHVHKAELEADVYIAVPVLKIHDTGITNALKLQVGSAPGCAYGYNKISGGEYYPGGLIHDVDQRRWTSEMIVDLSYIADIDFVVVDALMCLESYKTYRGDNQVRMNTIIAGADPVAVDHVSTRLFCLNPDDIAHITLAAKMGLGTNNTEEIVITGAPIEEVRKKVKMNESNEGKFGQSNRTWILSEAFDGTSVEDDYISDEASLRPAAGQDGWSEAVYFYDDRIDLYSYYGGNTNMVSYAFTYFTAPEDQVAELWLGTGEGIEVFLNGEMVYHYYSTNSSFNDDARGADVGDINIKKGENALLVKTLNKYGDYSFTLNICDPETATSQKGNRVDGLKFYTKAGTGVGSDKVFTSETQKLNVYPNPATDRLNIDLKFAAGKNLQAGIYSMDGKLIRSMDMNGSEMLSWDLNDNSGSRVSSGMYIVKVWGEDESRTAKVMVR